MKEDHMFKNWTFKQKMMMIPAAMLLFFLVILILSWINTHKIQKQNEQVSLEFYPAYILIRDMEEQLAIIQLQLQQPVSALRKDALKETDQSRDSMIALLNKARKNPVLDQERLEKHRQDFLIYYAHARKISSRTIDGNLDVALVSELKSVQNRHEALKNEFIQDRIQSGNNMNRRLETIRSLNLHSLLTMAIIIIVSMVLIGIVLFRLGDMISSNLSEIVTMMKDIAKGEGDLTRRMRVISSDELGDLANWFNLFVEKMHAIISQVKKNAFQVADVVTTINATASEMSAGTEEHNAQAGEVSASVEEMTASIMQNSQNASNTAKIAEDAGKQAHMGVETMKTTKKGMERIVESSKKMEEIVRTLTDQALQIGEIIQVIDKIADQTNLLALNAAVEAARAGEQGSGFAVVADEVRKLAERTVNATRKISETIESIQKDTILASETMMETKDAVESGQKATEQTESVLETILESVNMTVDMIQQIAAASEEQSAGAEEISSSVEAMNIVSIQTSDGVEMISSAAQDLNTQTMTLRDLVEHFKLNGSL
jgi:methyl-accepting chemotaxis protein